MITSQPDAGGHFGPYGGRYVPEVLMAPLDDLEKAYGEASHDPAFQAELRICWPTTPAARRRCTFAGG